MDTLRAAVLGVVVLLVAGCPGGASEPDGGGRGGVGAIGGSRPDGGASDVGGGAGSLPDAGPGGAGGAAGSLPDAGPGGAGGAPGVRLVRPSESAIEGALLKIPDGAAPPDQDFVIAIDPALTPGGKLDGRTTLGYAISYSATNASEYQFQSTGSGCVTVVVPYEGRRLAQMPQSVWATIAVGQLLNGKVLPVEATVDTSAHLASFCATHLSTYLVSVASDCTPVRFRGTYGYDPNAALSAQLDTPITFKVPEKLTLTGSGYIEVIIGPPIPTVRIYCRYEGSGEAVFTGCSDGSIAGDALTASEFSMGIEASEGTEFEFSITLPAISCLERGATCGLLTDQCGGTLNCADEGNFCTADSCDDSGAQIHLPKSAGESCSDGNLCNGEETCDGVGTCSAGTPPAVDDDVNCTIDICDSTSGISHLPTEWDNCPTAPDALASLCPSGVVSINALQLRKCEEDIGTTIQSAADSAQMDAAWAQFVNCIGATLVCVNAQSSDAERPATDPQFLASGPSVAVCDQAGYATCRQEAIEDYLTDSSFCSLVILAAAAAAAHANVPLSALALATYGLCMARAVIVEKTKFNRCVTRFEKRADQDCCGAERIPHCTIVNPIKPLCCACAPGECVLDGVCKSSNRCN